VRLTSRIPSGWRARLGAWVLGWVLPLSGTSEHRLQVDPRLEIQLWASEPDVLDPVSITFDAEGVAYVAECRDYPNGTGPAGSVQSAVRRLEDTDLDGRPDRSTVFAAGLSFATSVLPWRDGLLVLAPPQILFLRDTDNDGRADSREVLIEGLIRGVSDSLANSLRHHLDGWVHVANGGNGGRLTSRKQLGDPLDIEGMDFAFKPDTGELRLTGETGGGFGLVFDEWGRAFTTYNINHIQHRFLERHVVRRNTAFPPVSLTASISDHGEMSPIFPISSPATRPNHPEQAGHFSAAGGMGAGLSSAFPEDLQGSIFVGDVVGNLVHRDRIVRDGPGFRASRGPEESHSEFLASSDPAFRPVAFESGPDGALYIADMQRDVIEHPDYIPAKVRERQDLRAGDTRGRIYRVTPKGGLPPYRPNRREKGPRDWVSLLGHPDLWWRQTAQRKLLEAPPEDVLPRLREMAATDGRPLARLHAFWTLRALNSLTLKDHSRALTDGHPGVRENGLILAYEIVGTGTDLHASVVRLATDPDARVRMLAAMVLGNLGTDLASGTLRDLYRTDAESRWNRLAALSSMKSSDPRRFLTRFLGETGFRFAAGPGRIQILKELSEMSAVLAASNPSDFAWLLEHCDASLSFESRLAILQGAEAGLGRSGSKVRIPESTRGHLARLTTGAKPQEMMLVWRIFSQLQIPIGAAFERSLAQVVRNAAEESRPLPTRLQEIPLLEAVPQLATNLLPRLLTGKEVPEVQMAAFNVLLRLRAVDTVEIVLGSWPTLWPGVKDRAIRFLVDRRENHEALLAALESGRIQPGELSLDLEQRRRLLRSPIPAIRARAEKFWRDEEYSNRKAAVEEWMARLPATGDSGRGAKIFGDLCARCHKLGNVGRLVGPDLAGTAHRSVEDLLSNILDPNMAMNPSFGAYEVERQDGESIIGLLSSQTVDSVVLLLADEQRVTVPRTQIKSIRSTGRSLMPEGLEAGRTPQDLRDLIAFLRGEKVPAAR
jgi:putative membrane-bound dehydrogenase-like protein